MKAINIKFADFWSDQNHTQSFMYKLLSEKFDINLTSDPDYVIYSVFGYDHINFDCVRIFFTGEQCAPDFDIADYAIGFDCLKYDDRYFRIPLYALYYSTEELHEIESLSKIINISLVESRKFCSYLSSNKKPQSNRDNFFLELSKFKFVESGGSVNNNLGYKVSSKIEFIRNFNFNIAFENGNYKGYVTEKIVDAFKANTIPIYSGDPFVSDDFYESSFINVDKFESTKSAIEYINQFSNDAALILKTIKSNKFKPHVFEYRRDLFEFLSKIFEQDLISSKRRPSTYYSKIKTRNLKISDIIFYSNYRRLIQLKRLFMNLIKKKPKQ